MLTGRAGETYFGVHRSRISILEKKTDEFGLSMGSRFIENVRQIGFGRRLGDIAPPRRRRAAVSPQNLRGERRFRGGKIVAPAQFRVPPLAGIGVAHRDKRNRRTDAEPRNSGEAG